MRSTITTTEHPQGPANGYRAFIGGDYNNDISSGVQHATTQQASRIVGRALESAEGAGVTKINTLIGLPQRKILQTMLRQRQRERNLS